MLSELIDQQILSNSNTKYQHQHSLTHNYEQNIRNPSPNTLIQQNAIISFNVQNHQHPEQQIFLQRSSSKMSESTPGNHTCPTCNKSFYKNAHLIRHINQKHSDNRSFICTQPDCGKNFKRDSHLRRHMISHTHQKRFKCTLCIMAFGYKHHLDRHIKTVHDRVLLTCEECGQSFAKKKPFLKHVEKAHSKNNNNVQTLSRIRDDRESESEAEVDEQNKEVKVVKKSKKIKKARQANKKVDLKKIDAVQVSDIQSQEIEQSNEMQNGVQSSEKKNADKDVLLFRCVYTDCVSAFERMHELMRHIKQSHKQYQANPQQDEESN